MPLAVGRANTPDTQEAAIMPANLESGSIRGKAMRITKLDSCGNIDYGAKASLVTKGFVKIDFSIEREDGEETNAKNADGEIAVQDKGRPQIKYVGTEIQCLGVNPEMASMITGQPVILNAAGDAVGVPIGETVDSSFALEVWSDIPGGACVAGAKPFFYYVLPFMINGVFGNFTVEEALANFTLTAETKAPNQWGHGPYDVDLDAGDPDATPDPIAPAPAPLFQPIRPSDHLWPQRVYVSPPAPTDGAVELIAP